MSSRAAVGAQRDASSRLHTSERLAGWSAKEPPDQLKLDFVLWNRQAVVQMIVARLGVQLPIRTVGEYLGR